MHYYIDGYNMLFRLMHHEVRDLRSQREHIIYELDKKVALLNLNVSIVFDAAFQIGERSRSHFHVLEILFTAEGETADEYILDELKNSFDPQHEIIVTSDRDLAWRSRLRLAQTEKVEDFIAWLNKSYKNKLKSLRTSSKFNQASPPANSISAASPQVPLPEKAHSGTEDYYEQVFESRFQELVDKEESKKKRQQSQQPQQKKPQLPAKKKRFLQERPSVPEGKTEMERWLKAFEERINHLKE